MNGLIFRRDKGKPIPIITGFHLFYDPIRNRKNIIDSYKTLLNIKISYYFKFEENVFKESNTLVSCAVFSSNMY